MANSKNASQDIYFSEESVSELMKSFKEDEVRFAKLSSPLSNFNVDGDYSEN